MKLKLKLQNKHQNQYYYVIVFHWINITLNSEVTMCGKNLKHCSRLNNQLIRFELSFDPNIKTKPKMWHSSSGLNQTSVIIREVR